MVLIDITVSIKALKIRLATNFKLTFFFMPFFLAIFDCFLFLRLRFSLGVCKCFYVIFLNLIFLIFIDTIKCLHISVERDICIRVVNILTFIS